MEQIIKCTADFLTILLNHYSRKAINYETLISLSEIKVKFLKFHLDFIQKSVHKDFVMKVLYDYESVVNRNTLCS